MGRRADKCDAVIAAHLGEAVVFRQKPIAGVNGIHTAGGGCRQDIGDVEVALVARAFADANRLISELHVQCSSIHGAVHRNRADAEFSATSQDS